MESITRSEEVKCYHLAKEAHAGQVDKAGADYIKHPLTVAEILMDKFSKKLTKDEQGIAFGVALLHDVLEDTKLTQKDMLEYGIPFCVVSRCQIITRGENESYMNFVRRCGDDKIVRYVKMADLLNNMDITRLETLTDDDLTRLKKYHKAYKYLKAL
jgi:(p)ppGpp synthase/HD superfamily hydrolase